MAFSSWIRRTLLKNPETNQSPAPDPSKRSTTTRRGEDQSEVEEAEALGVNQRLISFITTFTLDSFNNFPLKEEEEVEGGGDCQRVDDESPTTSGNVRWDLSQWQQRHAMLVLSRVQEISRLRYMLCPRYLKEQQFWRIYFSLVKSYVTEYEQRAIHEEKLKRMTRDVENDKFSGKGAPEVEMAEAKWKTKLNDTVEERAQ